MKLVTDSDGNHFCVFNVFWEPFLVMDMIKD